MINSGICLNILTCINMWEYADMRQHESKYWNMLTIDPGEPWIPQWKNRFYNNVHSLVTKGRPIRILARKILLYLSFQSPVAVSSMERNTSTGANTCAGTMESHVNNIVGSMEHWWWWLQRHEEQILKYDHIFKEIQPASSSSQTWRETPEGVDRTATVCSTGKLGKAGENTNCGDFWGEHWCNKFCNAWKLGTSEKSGQRRQRRQRGLWDGSHMQ